MQQPGQPMGGQSMGGSQYDLSGRAKQMVQQAQQNLSEGAVTPSYKANREQIIQQLNYALAAEWTSFLQYEHHYYMASDIHNPGIREMWLEHANEELDHARRINDRINELGGVPANDPTQIAKLTPTPFEAGHDMRNMLTTDLVAERAVIQFYNELIRMCGFDDNETRHLIEDILPDENDHANEISNLLYQFDASTGKEIPTVHQEMLQQRGQQQGGQQQRSVGQ